MSDRKGKGLSGAISFRFSKNEENEEIEEIMLQDPTAENKPQSLPESGSGGGDTSPLKEMFKHKWANKWERRSLESMDIKGKIITAIEDKRKSIVSHFIPEEIGIIPPSTSIAEHIGYAGDLDSLQQQSQTSSSRNIPSCDSNLDDRGDVEEVGQDYLEVEDNHLDNMLKFIVAPELLQEFDDGEIPIYCQQPRNSELPIINKEDLQPSIIFNNIMSALLNHEWTKYIFCLVAIALFLPHGFGASFISPILWILVGSFSILVFQGSLQNIPSEANTANKNKMDPSVIDDESKAVKSTTTTKSDFSGTPSSSQTTFPVPSPSTITDIRSHMTRSQGWMTEFEGDYDPFTCNVRITRLIFVRLEGPMLYISYPHPKHRIPKRRLWNDPPISTDLQFVRHNIYNIAGATVSIWPIKLARKRAWNKKYPIAIQFPSNSSVTIISPIPSAEAGNPDNDRNTESIPDKEKKNMEQKKEITREDCSHTFIYLFSRSDREKDDWFRRLISASKNNTDSPEPLSSAFGDRDQDVLAGYFEYMRKIVPSDKFLDKSTSNSSKSDSKEKTSSGMDKSESSSSSKIDTPASSRKGSSPTLDDSIGLEKIQLLTIPHGPDFLNAFLGRIFHDFLRSPRWKTQVNDLIQKKLNYMRRPQFLDTLLVRELDLGSTIPIIQRASEPIIDKQGLWIDLDLSYDGNIVVTLETKLNLLKLRKSPSQENAEDSPNGSLNVSTSSIVTSGSANFSISSDSVSVSTKQSQNPSAGATANSGTSSITNRDIPSTSSSTMTINHSNASTPTANQANIFDSDADDSGESSEDEISADDFLAQSNDSSSKDDQQNSNESSGASKGMKILKMAEKIVQHKYVQQATDLKVVKKAIANVANTPLVLSVELKSLVGTLALNIPPPPTDRLWMGFRNNPSMQISARPKFGARAVNLTQVTDWIQKKLLHEFQRVCVFPNMNDVTIPLMEFKLPSC